MGRGMQDEGSLITHTTEEEMDMNVGARLERIVVGGEEVWDREHWVVKSLECAGLSQKCEITFTF